MAARRLELASQGEPAPVRTGGIDRWATFLGKSAELAGMQRPFENRTRFLGMSPRGEIASPCAQIKAPQRDLSMVPRLGFLRPGNAFGPPPEEHGRETSRRKRHARYLPPALKRAATLGRATRFNRRRPLPAYVELDDVIGACQLDAVTIYTPRLTLSRNIFCNGRNQNSFNPVAKLGGGS
jgi:hypothetical protein